MMGKGPPEVMPPDFKDWHENSRQEWPLIAAMTIESLRERVQQLETDPRLTLTTDDLSTYLRACGDVPEYRLPQAGRLRQRASKAEGIIAALAAVSAETEDNTTAQTVPLEREAVREYLDSCIHYWRDDPSPHAQYYIDAFQSVRTSLFGETLPKEADSE